MTHRELQAESFFRLLAVFACDIVRSMPGDERVLD